MPFVRYLSFYKSLEEKKKEMKKDYGRVDELLSEQHLHKYTDYFCCVKKSGAIALVLPGLTVG